MYPGLGSFPNTAKNGSSCHILVSCWLVACQNSARSVAIQQITKTSRGSIKLPEARNNHKRKLWLVKPTRHTAHLLIFGLCMSSLGSDLEPRKCKFTPLLLHQKFYDICYLQSLVQIKPLYLVTMSTRKMSAY
jgi:hypothetical protein